MDHPFESLRVDLPIILKGITYKTYGIINYNVKHEICASVVQEDVYVIS